MRFTPRRANRRRQRNVPQGEQFEDRRLLSAVMTVNSTADTNARDNFLTLRESILVNNRTLAVATLTATEQAQVVGTPTNADTDTIAFNIPGTGVQSISIATALPSITDPAIIDGYTQPGASANTLAVGSDAVLLIEVFSTSNQTGLVLSGGGSTVRGLVLNRFFDAVSVVSNNNVIEGNFIGIGPDGVTDRDNQFSGVRVTAGANNLIGGTTPAARNVLGGRSFFAGNNTAQIVVGKTSPGAPSVVNTTIRGNYIGINAAGTAAVTTAVFRKAGIAVTDGVNTIIGGTDADDGTLDGVVHARNIISGNGNGIFAEGTTNSTGYLLDGLTIQGNFVGLNATGTGVIANQGHGIIGGAPSRTTNLQLGGTVPGAGNVISGNVSAGFLGGARIANIQGNFVGTDVTGTLDFGNGSLGGNGSNHGLDVQVGPNSQVTIGGTTAAARNLVSGNADLGIRVVDGSRTSSFVIQGNFVGTQIDGVSPLGNGSGGILADAHATIGGTVPGAANVIAFNSSGVVVPITSNASSGYVTVPILGNSIHSNSFLGIDLNVSGVSLNDLGDTDTNLNNNGQNFPVLTGMNAVGGNTVISGRLNSNANSIYRIEFFYNDVRDPSGYGEGQTYLGFTNVTTDGSGNVSFVSPVVPGLIPAGRFVTATATKTSTSETSEFSFALCSLIVANTNDSGIGSLREAITCANTFVNFDRDGLAGNDADPITFAIPGAGVQTITPLSALPTINNATSIDGYTQPGASPNTLAVGNNAVLLVELNGTSAGGSANGLTLIIDSTVRGLVINRFGGSGVELVSANNVVEGSYLGIDPGGTIERSNLFAGVRVISGMNHRIGGTTPQARNVLAGNGSTTGTAQIVVGQLGNGATLVGTVIRGNYIGVNAAGSAAVHPTASGNDDGIYVARGVAAIIGGTDADDGTVDGVVMAGNVISGNLNGIRIDATGSDNFSVNGITIQGNLIGLDATGTQDVGNFGDGISAVRAAFTAIPSSIIQIGGTQPGAGNFISANDGRGFIGSAANLVLEGNRVGTDVSGTLNFGNGSQGVHVSLFGELGLNYQIRVGGTTPAARNIISGNAANGVLVTGDTSFGTPAIAIQGNYIGTQADGQSPLPNLLSGIQLQRNGSVGGTAAGAGNVIAFNRQRGVNLISGPTMPVLGNSIFGNGAAGNSLSHLGIDLGGNGLTPNDPGDGDFGVNGLQNFPVFGTVILGSGTVTIQYSVPTTTSNASYPLRIELFRADADGQEGQTFLGFDTYTAAEAGTVKTVVFTPAVTLAANDKVVATATDNLGNSSEFSASQTVTGVTPSLSINDISLNEGASGITAFTFTVTLSANPSSNVSVTVNTANGTTNPATTADNDYSAITNQVLTFVSNGPLTQTVTVNITGDSKFERNETFFVNLSGPTGATLADGQGLGTIQNDDLAPALSFSTTNSVLEGNVAADDRKVPFTVTLSAVSGVDVTGTISTASGTATEGTDFVSADGVAFVIPAGQTQATILVSVIEDTTFEPDEQFTIEAAVSDPSTVNNSGGTASGTGTIENDDTLPTLSINDVSLNEGVSGTTAFTFTVTLSANPSSNVTVTVNTANGTTNPATTADNDYAAITNLALTFVPNGPLTQTVTVNVTGDNKFELTETFFVQLSSPTGATLTDSQGLGTIQNDDLAPTLSFSANNSVQEGNVTADDRKVSFTLTLSAVSGVYVAGTINTTSGTAIEGTDFVSADGVAFLIPAGQTQATIFVSVIEDTDVEADEQFTIDATATDPSTVSNSNGLASGTGTIHNDDFTLSIDDVSGSEGASGTTTFTFSVTLSGNPTSNVTVTANTANGTTNPATTADSDYTAITNLVLTFLPNGPLTQTVTVNVTGDNKFELTETFFVDLSNPEGATLTDSHGLGTIQNDDLAPTISFSASNSVQEGNVTADDRKVPFAVSLSAISGVDVAGTINTTSGTATEGTDFVSADGVAFLIPAGQSQATIFVSVIEDTDVEADEQFTIDATATDASTVSNSNGLASGTGTIQNDDSASNSPVSIGPGCGVSALIINGSNANDTIRVVPQGQNAVKVLINGQNYGSFEYSSFQEIIVYGNNGNDDVELAGNISTPAFLFGEAGNDRLKGGNGANVLVGGNGDDNLIGSQAADVIIGGDGSDRLVGNGGDDLLIAGWTDHDTNLAALCAILDEWSRTDTSYDSRISNLRVGGGRNGSVRLNYLTVHDDGDYDRLTGSAGQDWFFANTGGNFLDQITDRHSTELVDDID